LAASISYLTTFLDRIWRSLLVNSRTCYYPLSLDKLAVRCKYHHWQRFQWLTCPQKYRDSRLDYLLWHRTGLVLSFHLLAVKVHQDKQNFLLAGVFEIDHKLTPVAVIGNLYGQQPIRRNWSGFIWYADLSFLFSTSINLGLGPCLFSPAHTSLPIQPNIVSKWSLSFLNRHDILVGKRISGLAELGYYAIRDLFSPLGLKLVLVTV